jgi:putative sigma-54 modulation protein
MTRTTIKATNIELTPELREYAEKRVSALEKYLSNDELIHIEVGQGTKHKHGDVFRAEIRFMYQGKQLYATAEKSDIFTAIDTAKEQIARETSSLKTRLHKRFRDGAKRVKDMVQGFSSSK